MNLLAIILLFTGLGSLQGENVEFTLDSDEYELTEGHIRLEWKGDLDDIYELQQAQKEDFSDARTIYKGPDLASFISGLRDGTYYYRVRAENGQWSEPVTLVVKHQSLNLAFTLFGLGAVVFLLTVFVVLKGVREQNNTNSKKV